MKTQFMHIMTESHGGVTLALRRTELENCAVQYKVKKLAEMGMPAWYCKSSIGVFSKTRMEEGK